MGYGLDDSSLFFWTLLFDSDFLFVPGLSLRPGPFSLLVSLP